MWQMTYAFLAQALAALIGHGGSPAAGPLFGVWLGLYQTGTPQVTPQSTMANIVEANYDGYSRQQVTWFPPFISSLGPEQILGLNLFFEPIDANVPNLVTGAFLSSAFYGGVLLGGAPAPGQGVPLTGPTTALSIKPAFQMGTGLIYGGPEWEA